jgi:hypothetical protein
MLTLGVCSWGSCVYEGFIYERHEKVWNEKKTSTSLHWTVSKSGSVAYKLKLPPLLAGVHNIFHVSQIKKCLKEPMDVVLPKVAPLEADLTYPEHPVKILDQKDCVT